MQRQGTSSLCQYVIERFSTPRQPPPTIVSVHDHTETRNRDHTNTHSENHFDDQFGHRTENLHNKNQNNKYDCPVPGPDDIKPQPFDITNWKFWANCVLSPVMSVTDMVTDILLICQWLRQDNFVCGLLSLSFVLIHSTLQVILDLKRTDNDHTPKLIFRSLLLGLTQLTIPFESIKHYRFGSPGDDRIAKILGMMFETCPQTYLQMYVLTVNSWRGLNGVNTTSLILSLINLCFHLTKVEYDGRKTRFDMLVIFCYTLFDILSRGLIVSIFSCAFGAWVALPIGLAIILLLPPRLMTMQRSVTAQNAPNTNQSAVLRVFSVCASTIVSLSPAVCPCLFAPRDWHIGYCIVMVGVQILMIILTAVVSNSWMLADRSSIALVIASSTMLALKIVCWRWYMFACHNCRMWRALFTKPVHLGRSVVLSTRN